MLLPARPSGLNATSMPSTRRNAGARRRRPASASIFGPAGNVPRNAITDATGAGSQKVGGAARPRAALGYDVPHASGGRVSVDETLDHSPAGCLIGAAEGLSRPKGRFAGCCPERLKSAGGESAREGSRRPATCGAECRRRASASARSGKMWPSCSRHGRALGPSNCARFEQIELRGDRLRRDIALELLVARVLDKNDQRLPELTARRPT